MHLYIRTLAFWSCCLCLQPDVLAQEDSTTLQLDNITITENRMQTPFSESARSIHVITRKDIQRTAAQSLAEVLNSIPGVDIRQRGPAGVQADVSIRGGTFEQTLILINGIKMSDPQTGHHLMNLPLDLENIERIEVLKGPGARIYGQNAFAGAINIITKVPEEAQLNAGMYGGDFTTLGGHAGLALHHGNYGQYLSIASDQSEGYRFNTDYSISNIFYQSQLKVGAGKFNLMGGFTKRSFGASGYYYQPDSEEYEEVGTGFISLDYEKNTDHWRIQPRLYWRSNHDDYLLIRSDPEYYNNIHQTYSSGAEFHATRQSKLGLTGLGVEVRRESIQSNSLGNWQRTNAGLFAEHRFYLLNKLDVTPGLYWNWSSDYGWNFFPGIDAAYSLSQKLKLFANAGKSFRIPTYTDLYYQSPNNIGNDQLEPEEAWTYEGGAKYFAPHFWGQLSYFNRDASRLIDWVRFSEAAPWQPRNFYQVNVQGVEASANLIFSDTQWIQQLSLEYTYIDAMLGNTENVISRYALDNLKHQLIFSVTHTIYGNIRHSLRARYLDRVTQNDYFVIDNRVFYQNELLNIYAETSNLTNTAYTETGYVPMPGRWFRAGVTFTLGL